MAYIPQSGINATLEINSVVYTVREMSFQSTQDTFECSSLSDLYKKYFGARRVGRITATLLVTSDAADGIVTSFQSVASLGAAIGYELNDANSVNTYSGVGFIEDATHNMTGGDVDTLTISMIVDGVMAP
jgi:hypothetical protein